MRISFKDRQLEKDIRKSINKPKGDLSKQDIDQVKKINIEHYSDEKAILVQLVH